jgi:hypothetical protein
VISSSTRSIAMTAPMTAGDAPADDMSPHTLLGAVEHMPQYCEVLHHGSGHRHETRRRRRRQDPLPGSVPGGPDSGTHLDDRLCHPPPTPPSVPRPQSHADVHLALRVRRCCSKTRRAGTVMHVVSSRRSATLVAVAGCHPIPKVTQESDTLWRCLLQEGYLSPRSRRLVQSRVWSVGRCSPAVTVR